MASKTADAIKLVLRLPKPLHKRLKQQAARNNVSLNTEIVNQLSNPKDPRLAALEEKIPGWLKDAIASLQRDGYVEIEGARVAAHDPVLEREKREEQK